MARKRRAWAIMRASGEFVAFVRGSAPVFYCEEIPDRMDHYALEHRIEKDVGRSTPGARVDKFVDISGGVKHAVSYAEIEEQ